jgi:hypothetical protein
MSGLSFYYFVQMRQTEGDNFLCDFGVDPQRNRISIFAEPSFLTFRVLDSTGTAHVIRVPFGKGDLQYDEWTTIILELGIGDTDGCMSIDVGGKHHIFSRIPSLELLLEPYIVLGSDVSGTANSEFLLRIQGIWNLTFSFADKGVLLMKHYEELLNVGTSRHVEFAGRKYMYTPGHPNFPPSQWRHNGFTQTDPKHRPVIRAPERDLSR